MANISALQSEILYLRKKNEELKQENMKWKNKFVFLQTMYQQVINKNDNNSNGMGIKHGERYNFMNGYNRYNGDVVNNGKGRQRKHSYPTPKPITRVVNGYLLKNYRDWNGNDIANWIINLNTKYGNITIF